MKKSPYDNPRALQALLKAGDDAAIAYVVRHVKEAGGSIQGAAKEIGVSARSIGNWRASSPKLDRALGRVALGRAGAMKHAGAVRLERLRRS